MHGVCWVQAWDTGFPARQYEPELEKGTARRAAQTQNLMIDSEGAFLGSKHQPFSFENLQPIFFLFLLGAFIAIAVMCQMKQRPEYLATDC